MNRDRMIRISAQAAKRHGVMSRRELLALGASSNDLVRMVDRGQLERPLPAVYLFPSSPATWERAVAIAVKGAGESAIASHATAAHLWGLGPRPRVIEVTTDRKGVPDRDYVIHRSTDLVDANRVLVKGIPCATVERLLVDIGIPWGEGAAARSLDEAVRKRQTTDRKVARELHRVARRGRNGVGPMRVVLAERLGWAGLTESQIEAEFLRIMNAAGVDLPRPQVKIRRRGGKLIARVDFVYAEIRLVIELDGERYHSDQRTFRRDRRQQNDLVLEGYRVLRFTAWDVFAAPEYVVASVVAALAP